MRFCAFPERWSRARTPADEEFEAAVMAKVDEALKQLNQMREEEGRGHRTRTSRSA